MAFQTGTQVRPELGRADVSGFARAGMITGQALANLGAQVGGAIAASRQKKEKAAQDKAFDEVLVGISQKPDSPMGAALRGIGIVDAETAAVARKSLGDKFQPTLNMLMQMEAESQQFQPEMITLGEGENAVRAVRTSRGQIQLLPGQETEEKTAAIRNYEYFVDKGMPEEEARKIFFGDGDSTASALSKFLSGEGGNDVPTGGTEPVEEPEVEAEDEEAEEPKATVLSARQRAVQEMQTKERAERPAGPAKMAPGLTPEQQARLQELLLKQQGL